MTTDLTDPSSAPSPLATRLAAVTARRRHLDGQVASLQAFEQHLTQKVRAARTARGRPEQVRKLMSRLLGVRARLQEFLFAQGRAIADEDRPPTRSGTRTSGSSRPDARPPSTASSSSPA